MTDQIEAIAVVHFDADGELTYHIASDGRFRLFIIDERAPHDRVYEWTSRCDASDIADLLGDSPIGSSQDARHPAIKARIEAIMDGKPYLEEVKP